MIYQQASTPINYVTQHQWSKQHQNLKTTYKDRQLETWSSRRPTIPDHIWTLLYRQ